jgi:Intracellular proteinase inhibitor
MKFSLTASLLFVATLSYACGPRTRSDASYVAPVISQQGFALASIAGARVRSASTREKTLKNESIKLTTSFDVAQQQDAVHFELRVTNTTGKRVELTFASGQAYDFIVVDSVGREVWRWADGRVFTQSVQNKLLGKGEGITISEKWSPARPGKYAAIALLRSTNYPLQQRVEFERR